MKYISLISIAFVFTACTYSINQVSTKGTASDVIDENQEASPDISPEVNIPLVNGPSEPENYPQKSPKGLNGPMKII